jgi:hypothetical protein
MKFTFKYIYTVYSIHVLYRHVLLSTQQTVKRYITPLLMKSITAMDSCKIIPSVLRPRGRQWNHVRWLYQMQSVNGRVLFKYLIELSTSSLIKEFGLVTSIQNKAKKICVSGYPTYPIFWPPTLNFFLPFRKNSGNWHVFPKQFF